MDVELVRHQSGFAWQAQPWAHLVKMPLLPTKLQEIRDETTRLAREAGPDMEEDGQRGALVTLRAPAAPTRDEVEEHEAPGTCKLQNLVQSKHCGTRSNRRTRWNES